MSSRMKKNAGPSISPETGTYLRPIIAPLILSIVFLGAGTVGAQGLGEKIHLSGYGNFHSMDHSGLPRLVGRDNPNDAFFQMREFSLFFDFDLTEGIIASLELQAVSNATKFIPAYAYVDIDIPTFVPFWKEDLLGGLGVRIGRLLVPFLSYNENKASFKQNLMSPPFTAQHLVPVLPNPPDFNQIGWTDTGLTVNWFRDVGNLGLLDLKISLIGGLGSDSDVLDDNSVRLAAGASTPRIRPRDGLRANGEFAVRNNNHGLATVVKLNFVPSAFPIDLGASWYRGTWDPASTQTLHMYGVHANWLARNWTLKGEWAQADVEQTAGTNVTGGSPAINTSTGDYSLYAWYVEGSYIPFRWGPSDNRYLRLVVRYDDVETNNKVDFSPFSKYRITPGMELQFSSFTRFRYEFQYQTLKDFRNAPAAFKAAGGKRHITMHMLSMIFWF